LVDPARFPCRPNQPSVTNEDQIINWIFHRYVDCWQQEIVQPVRIPNRPNQPSDSMLPWLWQWPPINLFWQADISQPLKQNVKPIFDVEDATVYNWGVVFNLFPDRYGVPIVLPVFKTATQNQNTQPTWQAASWSFQRFMDAGSMRSSNQFDLGGNQGSLTLG